METVLNYAPFAVLLLIALGLWRLFGRRSPGLPYSRRSSLLTAGEMRFYWTLAYAVPEGLLVMVKVRLMDVVEVPADSWREYGAPGSGMHCDFVLADAGTLAVVLVIELDDRSHLYGDARRRDAIKDAALGAAGVPILRVKVGWYDAGELRARVAGAVAGE